MTNSNKKHLKKFFLEFPIIYRQYIHVIVCFVWCLSRSKTKYKICIKQKLHTHRFQLFQKKKNKLEVSLNYEIIMPSVFFPKLFGIDF